MAPEPVTMAPEPITMAPEPVTMAPEPVTEFQRMSSSRPLVILTGGLMAIVMSLLSNNIDYATPTALVSFSQVCSLALLAHTTSHVGRPQIMSSWPITALLTATHISPGFAGSDDKICTTESCVHAASRLLQYMNQRVDPCDDFYEYACGNYGNNHVIPPGSGSYGSINVLVERLRINLKGLLESPIIDTDTEVVKRTKNYYMSCMNEAEIDNLGIKPLKDFVKNEWAVLNENFDTARFNLEDYWLKLASGSPWPGYWTNLFSITSQEDFNNSTRYIVSVGEGELGIGSGTRDYYLKGANSPIMVAYRQMVVDIAVRLGADENFAKSEISKMVDFEIKLANLTLPSELKSISAGLFKSINITTLMNDYPGVDWRKLIFTTFQRADITLSDETILILSETPYFEKIGSLLKATDARTLATYMMWKIIKVKTDYLDIKTREIVLNFKKVYEGVATASPRHEVCTTDTNNKFQFVATKMFADKYFTKGTSDVQDMAQRIKAAFRERLSKVDWLDETSRAKALEKVDYMKAMMAYPDDINNDTWLSEDVMKFGPMSPLEYFNNGVRTENVDTMQNLKRLNKAVDHDAWQMPPVIVNAYYTPNGNRIVFPVGILQPPFYDMDGVKYLNYGALGFVMGHEITHGFDVTGGLFDAFGNKKEWMTNTSVAQFNERAKCFIHQYGNITVKDIEEKVNGQLTQGENIADNGGLATAFQAYSKWVKDNEEELLLPGLSLTPYQLFFVSMAQFGCQLFTPETLRTLLLTDAHTPGPQRTFGALINSVEFAHIYNCRLEDKMNHGKKCSLW